MQSLQGTLLCDKVGDVSRREVWRLWGTTSDARDGKYWRMGVWRSGSDIASYSTDLHNYITRF